MTPPNAWLHSTLPYLWPIVWIVAAIVVGLVVDQILLRRLMRGRFVAAHPWLRIGIDAVRGGVLFWFAIAGIHAAMITSPLDRNVVRILDDILLVLGFGSLTWVAARFAGGMIHARTSGASARVLSASLLASITQSAIVTLGVLVILESLGIAIAPLLTALGVGGLAVALALQPTLANLFAGVQLVASRSLRPGDFISISGFEGYVEDVTWRTTAVRNLAGNIVIIPNQTIATTAFVNYRLETPAFALELPFTIKSGADIDKIQREAVAAAIGGLESVDAKPADGLAPFVRFEQVGADGSLNATLVMRLPRSADAGHARNETLKRLFKVLGESPPPKEA